MREDQDDERDRWPTINLKPDQLEQIIATDVVETMRIDRPMQIVLARLEGRPEPKAQVVSYGAPILMCTLSIVFGSLTLLLESHLWSVMWSVPGMIGFGAAALCAAIAAIVLLIQRIQDGR